MPSNQTSLLPGDSASESQGASGLRTAKLSPISGNAAGEVAEHPASVLSAEPRHPYSGMSAADYNVEPTGNLGLTANELASVGNTFIFSPTPTELDRDEKLFTSTLSRPTHWVTAVHGESFPLADATSHDCRIPGNSQRPRALAFRLDETGSLVPVPDFVQCNCTRCQELVFPAATDDPGSAKRKLIPFGESSRDDSDVSTSTDVPTRPPMYDAKGAEKLGVEVSCPSEASPQVVEMSCPSEASSQDAAMSCPSEASSQDVRPVVSTADAMSSNQVSSTADAMTVNTNGGLNQLDLSKVKGVVGTSAEPLLLCDGSTWIPRSQLVNDAELSIDHNQFAFSNLLDWRPQPREEPTDGFPHFLDDGGYLSDGQPRSDYRSEWHGKKRFLSILRGLCIPSYTLDLSDHPDR